MLIVAEGISAAGKTTWASRYAPAVVDELSRKAPSSDVCEIGRYWSDRHSERWQRGLQLERLHGVACLDTDPLKIHYAWCLWQIGQGSRDAWTATVEATRLRLAEQQIGFADRIAFLEPSDEAVRRQKANDTSRRRRHFEMHVLLYEPLRRWYGMLEDLAPGRVIFNAHEVPDLAPCSPRNDRYSVELFDAFINAADRHAG